MEKRLANHKIVLRWSTHLKIDSELYENDYKRKEYTGKLEIICTQSIYQAKDPSSSEKQK